jgi:uncharacterized protein YuzE
VRPTLILRKNKDLFMVYLEITFRKGKALAAYIYLSKKVGVRTESSKKIRDGIIIDFDIKNNVIGLEITAPDKISANEINEILSNYKIEPIPEKELDPLKAA